MASRRFRGGTGEPLVLVHGIGGSWRNWLPVLPALARAHDCLAVGLLGHWNTEPLPDGVRPTVAALVDGVEREMDEAGMQTAHLVGNSLGGWIVLELAKRGRAASVVAISPGGSFVPGSLSADLVAVRLLLEHRITHRFVAPRAQRLVRSSLGRRLLFGGVVAHPERIDEREGLDMLRGFGGTDVFRALLASMRRTGPFTGGEQIAAPILVAWGTRDLVLPLRPFGTRMGQLLPQAEFRRLPGLGHVPMHDDPAGVAALIADWTARHPPQGASAGSTLLDEGVLGEHRAGATVPELSRREGEGE